MHYPMSPFQSATTNGQRYTHHLIKLNPSMDLEEIREKVYQVNPYKSTRSIEAFNTACDIVIRSLLIEKSEANQKPAEQCIPSITTGLHTEEENTPHFHQLDYVDRYGNVLGREMLKTTCDHAYEQAEKNASEHEGCTYVHIYCEHKSQGALPDTTPEVRPEVTPDTTDHEDVYSTFEIKYWSNTAEIEVHQANGYSETTATKNFRLFHPSNAIINVTRLAKLNIDPTCTEESFKLEAPKFLSSYLVSIDELERQLVIAPSAKAAVELFVQELAAKGADIRSFTTAMVVPATGTHYHPVYFELWMGTSGLMHYDEM